MARDWLLQRFPKNSIGAEIGVWAGTFSNKVLNIVKPTRFYLVDPWKLNPNISSPLYGINTIRTQKDLDLLYQKVKRKFKHESTVSIHRTSSTNFIPDNHLDWVYIDSNHEFIATYQSLIDSLRYVKPNGIIAGDDFQTDGWWKLDVIKAVMKFIDEYPIHVDIIKSNQFILRKGNVKLS